MMVGRQAFPFGVSVTLQGRTVKLQVGIVVVFSPVEAPPFSSFDRLLRVAFSTTQEEYCMTLRARLQVTLAEAIGKKHSLVGFWLYMLFRESFQKKGFKL